MPVRPQRSATEPTASRMPFSKIFSNSVNRRPCQHQNPYGLFGNNALEWSAQFAMVLVRLRRQQPPAQDSPRTADLLQQPPGTARLRAHFQCLVRRQNPTAEPDHRLSVAVPQACRRRQHHSQPSAPPTAISVTEPGSASGNGSTWAKARSARHCRGAARRPNCRLEPRTGRQRRKSSPICRPPSPTPTVLSPPSNMPCAPSSCKPVPSSPTDTHTVTHPMACSTFDPPPWSPGNSRPGDVQT